MAQRSIGVFDSGVGGLSVLSQIRACLPHESLSYLADSSAAPYGDKAPEFVRHRVIKIADFFLKQGVKLIVVACNTATTASVQILRQYCDLPIVAIEPAIKPAASLSNNGIIGVIATQQTINNQRLTQLKEQFAKEKQVLFQACPGLVEMVEKGEQDTPGCKQLLHHYLHPLLQQSIDTLVLGCTHYPFLHQQIKQIVGPHVQLIDPANAVARQVKNVLADNCLLSPLQVPGNTHFFTTGEADKASRVISQLWGQAVEVQRCNID